MGSLRLKRGDSTDRLNYTPLEGELILDTDTQQLFIGDGVTAGGNAVVAGNANVTIVSNYSNANVAGFLPVYGGNITANVITANSVTGVVLSNVPAGNLTGTIPSVVLGNSTTYVGTTAIPLNRSSAVQDLTGVSSVQNGNSNVAIVANGNVTINAVGGTRLTAFSTGVDVTGTFSVSGNATVNGLTSNTTASVTGNLTAGNLVTAGRVVATGNVLGDHFVGNAINLTGNISATTFISTATTGTAPLSVLSTTEVANLNVKNANTVTNPTQANITSIGTLTSLVVTGNANIGQINSNGGNIQGTLQTNMIQAGFGFIGNLTSNGGLGEQGYALQTFGSGGPTAPANVSLAYTRVRSLERPAYFQYNNSISAGYPGLHDYQVRNYNTFVFDQSNSFTRLSSNFTVNLVDVPDFDPSTSFTFYQEYYIVINQFTTARYPTGFSINGVAKTIKWRGGSQLVGNASKIDVYKFTVVYTVDDYTQSNPGRAVGPYVLGDLITYG